MWFRQDDEVLAFATAPSGGDRDAVFVVEGMAKFAGEEFLWW